MPGYKAIKIFKIKLLIFLSLPCLARSQMTNQTGIHRNNPAWSSDKAVDGRLDRTNDLSENCARIDNEIFQRPAEWFWDLGTPRTINTITIYNTYNAWAYFRMVNFHLSVIPDSGQRAVLCGNDNTEVVPKGRSRTVRCPSGTRGRFIRFVRITAGGHQDDDVGRVTICEVILNQDSPTELTRPAAALPQPAPAPNTIAPPPTPVPDTVATEPARAPNTVAPGSTTTAFPWTGQPIPTHDVQVTRGTTIPDFTRIPTTTRDLPDFRTFFPVTPRIAGVHPDDKTFYREVLLNTLLRRYGANRANIVLPPRPMEKERPDVTIGLIPQRARLDIPTSILTADVLLTFSWMDLRLQWDPSRNGNVSLIPIPSKDLWTPDIVLYNSVDKFEPDTDLNVLVTSKGKVSWVQRVKINIDCMRNFQTFTCPATFRSWVYDAETMDVRTDTTFIDMSQLTYTSQGLSMLPTSDARRNVRFYPCCPGVSYPDVTFTLRGRQV